MLLFIGFPLCSCCPTKPSPSLPSLHVPRPPSFDSISRLVNREHRSSSVADLRRKAREHSQAVLQQSFIKGELGPNTSHHHHLILHQQHSSNTAQQQQPS